MPPKKMKLNSEDSSCTSSSDESDNECDETTNENQDMISTSELDNNRILKAYLAGKTVKDIALILDMKKRRVKMIVKNYAENGRVTTSYSAPPPPPSVIANKLTPEQIVMLKMWAKEDATVPRNKLIEKFTATFGVRLSTARISKLLDNFIYSIRRISPKEEIVNDIRTIALRKEFAQIFTELSSSYAVDLEMVFVGQMRFRLNIRGKDSEWKLRCRNMSICVAFNKLGVIDFIGQNLPISRDQFEHFLFDVINSLKTNDGVTSGIIIMDEGDIKDDLDSINKLISEQGFANIYLPPNSPFLNPVECLFSEWRELMDRVKPSNELNVVNTIEQGRKIILAEDCNRYYQTVNVYMEKCINGEVIDPNQNISTIFIEEDESGENGAV